MKILIVGGVAGGATAAARLRRLNEENQIVMLERGAYISYANCGLPYYIGGEITDKNELTLQTPAGFAKRYNIDVRVRHEAVRIDRTAKVLHIVDHENGREYTETYDRLLLSPGAAPVKPDLPGVDDARVFTLRTVPDTFAIREFIEREKPKTALVVGGGFIGLEMAENLAHAGLAVTLAEYAPQVLPPLDAEMACEVQAHLRERGVKLLLGDGLQGIIQKPDGTLAAQLGSGEVEAGMVLLAMGVRPESGLAAEAGLATGVRGAIVVNEHLQTSDASIYAVGDAIEVRDFVTGEPAFVPLAGPANKQGRIAADNLAGIPSVYNGTQGSAVVKLFDLTVAATGVNEKTAKRAGLDYDKTYLHTGSHAGYYPGAVPISIKVLFEQGTGCILGAQLVGKGGVDKRADVLATAIRAGMTADDLAELELAYAPPYSSAKDPVNMAGYVIQNVVLGRLKQYHWHDVDSLPSDGSITRLDVRTAREYAAGHVAGTVHIPLDELRQRYKELEPGKPVYINCQSGLRSYLACEILAAHGFDCYNLAGGWRQYALAAGCGLARGSGRGAP